MNGYNTGKVVIGCRYEPPKRSHMSTTVMTWKKTVRRANRMLKVLGVGSWFELGAVVAVAVTVAGLIVLELSK